MRSAKIDSLKQADLHEWFAYEPDTGIFRWKKIPPRFGRDRGDLAGSVHQNKTRGGKARNILWVQGKRIYAGRAAFIYVHGDIPDNALVDHADGDTLNDRIDNLRLASAAQNVWNRQRPGALLTGVTKGRKGRFQAKIFFEGKYRFLGTWATEAEAHAAHMGASAIVHGAFSLNARGLPESEPPSPGPSSAG